MTAISSLTEKKLLDSVGSFAVALELLMHSHPEMMGSEGLGGTSTHAPSNNINSVR
jgi:hypothetical protein